MSVDLTSKIWTFNDQKEYVFQLSSKKNTASGIVYNTCNLFTGKKAESTSLAPSRAVNDMGSSDKYQLENLYDCRDHI